MKSSVTFLKSLLTNRFVLGNGFLSMFGCVCVFLSENGDILFQKDSQEICVCLVQQTPAHCWFVGWWVQHHFMALMGSYLVASLLGFYIYVEIVSAPITSEPFTLQN